MATSPKKTSPAGTYLRFVQLASELKARPSSPALEPDEGALLDALALHWRDNKTLAVREAMALATLGSPSTLHRRISWLRTQGWIQDQSSPANQRIKLLVPTDKSLVYYGMLGAALMRTANSAL